MEKENRLLYKLSQLVYVRIYWNMNYSPFKREAISKNTSSVFLAGNCETPNRITVLNLLFRMTEQF